MCKNCRIIIYPEGGDEMLTKKSRKLCDVGNEVYAARIAGASQSEVMHAVQGGLVGARERLSRGVFIVFSGEGPNLQFVEVEDARGAGIKVGEWIDRGDGYHVLHLVETDCV